MNEDYTLLTKIILANFQDQITPAQRINQKFIAFDSVFYVFFFLTMDYYAKNDNSEKYSRADNSIHLKKNQTK